MNIIDIYTDSPNGFEITAHAPKAQKIDSVVRYYLDKIESYFPSKYPIEYGVCNYALATAFFNDRNIKQDIAVNSNLERSKRIENGLYYFNQSLEIFTQKDYPIMYSLVNIYMAKLFRERSLLTLNRSFLSDRSTPEESLQYGIDHALEALDILSLSRPHQVELALCCLELGHLFLLQSEQHERADDIVLKEQTLTYLERAIALSSQLSDTLLCIGAKGKPFSWRPDTVSTFPLHIRDFLEHRPFSFLEGCAYYLLGRLEASWGMVELESNLSRSERSSRANPHHISSFEHFCRCVRPKYLEQANPLWSDAHHRVALLIIQHPVIVDPEFNDHDVSEVSDIYLDSAISHLQLALRCQCISKTSLMDIHFHLAQAYISKLQLIIDKVPYGQSITRAVANSEGLDLIHCIDKHLNEALSRVTAANTQSAQDAYLYFFSCLKLAEYRMLEAAATPNLSAEARETFLKDAIEYIIDACLARPLPDNMDLHYIASCQLGQVLVAVKRQHAASKSFAKILFCLSTLLNRSIFNLSIVETKLREDLAKHTTQALGAAMKEVNWIKLHLGPTSLHERVSPGYATWSFEDIPSARYSLGKTDSETILDVKPPQSKHGTQESELDQTVSALVVTKASPPKGVPPLNLPIKNFKKVHLSGEEIPDENIHKASHASLASSAVANNLNLDGSATAGIRSRESVGTVHFKPPAGPVPLSALGHTIPKEALEDEDVTSTMDRKKIEQEILEGKRPLISPYTQRMRTKVPPIEEMNAIDRANRATYGLSKSKIVHLIPNKALRDQMKSTMPPRPDNESTSSTFQDKRKLILPGNAETRGDYSSVKKGIAEVHGRDGEDFEDEEEVEQEEQDLSVGGEGEEVIDRPRSRKIVRFNSASNDDEEDSPDRPLAVQNNNFSAEADMVTTPQQRKNRPRSGLLSFGLFAKKKKQDQNENDRDPTAEPSGRSPQRKGKKGSKPWLLALFSSKSKPKPLPRITIDTSKWKEEKLMDSVGFWASKQAYFVLMLSSRQSRMELLTKCKALRVIEGERACNILYHVKPSYRDRFQQLRQQLISDCEKLIPSSPNSLKELAQLSIPDLQILFRSHNKMIRRLDEFEFFLAYKMTKYDYFLPMILVAPVFTRDISLLDEALLDSQRLLSNLAFEKGVQDRPSEKPEKLEGVIKVRPGITDADDILTLGTKKSKSSNHTRVIDRNSSAATTASNIFNTDKKARMTEEEKKQQAAEREEILVGKMTFSQSTLLDGAHYLRNGQQGLKEMIARYLGLDECLMIWNLPNVGHQTISVTLVWRENSLSQHEFFSAAEAVEARLYDESHHRRNAYKHLKESKTRNKNRQGKRGEVSGIVVELAKSDLEASHLLQYIQRYLDALHSEPLAKRMTLVNDAIRSVSCALSITELLLMIPLYVTSLVICCPPVMRVLPWHLLLIETFQRKKQNGNTGILREKSKVLSSLAEEEGEEEAEKELVEIHLLERYCVRLGPSLSLFELNCMSGSILRQSVGLHKLCALDGDDHDDLQAIPTSAPFSPGATADESHRFSSSASVLTQSTANRTAATVKKHAKHHHAAGIRGADLEVASVSHIWSADPEDYHVLNNHAASFAGFETGVSFNENYAMYTKYKDELAQTFQPPFADEELEGEQLGELDDNSVALDLRASKILKKLRKKKKKDYLFKKSQEGGEKEDESEEEEDEEDEEPNEEEEVKEQRRNHQQHVKALAMCRVLHLCASKTLLSDSEVKEKAHPFASVILPKADPFNFQTSKRRTFNSSDVVKKLFLRNCGLAVLSRFGLSDDLLNHTSPIIDLNCDFIESFHLAGASTVMYPLWEGSGQGIGTLAHILYFLRFYSILPTKSRHRLSVVETCRKTQLWLRDLTANDAIAFVHKAPIPSKARHLIIEEIESYVNSTVATLEKKTQRKRDVVTNATSPTLSADNLDNGEGNRVGGTHKFFTHVLSWGSFVVSGFGGNIHHPELTPTDDPENDQTAMFGTHVTNDPNFKDNISAEWNDKELDNIEFEASILRLEGKAAEAAELEKRIRELKMKKWKNRIKKVQQTGWKAGRGLLDTIDYFDKLLLEQDDEELSVSSDEENASPGKSKSAKHGKHSLSEKRDAEVADEDNGDDRDAPPPPNSSRLQFNNNNSILPSSNKAQFRPLNLDNKGKKAIYDEWKTKVGDLSMEVKQPTLSPDHFIKKNQKKKAFDPNIQKKDNFDFAMMRSIKSKVIKEEEDEEEEDLDDYDEGKEDEEESISEGSEEDDKAKRKSRGKRKGKNGLWSAFGEVRSYAEIAHMISEQYPLKVIDQRIQSLEDGKEKCTVS